MASMVPSPDSGRFDVIPYADLSPEATWRTLGRGSFGRVFKGQYLGLDVAIKEVLDSDEYDVDKYFRRECTLMKECRHPNIVQFIGLCLAPPSPPEYLPTLQNWEEGKAANDQCSVSTKPSRRRILIISEYLPNGNLRSHIANNKLDFGWRLRLSFSVDVARAMAYLHARNCLHRDLKGENLLITENDRVKVCDFGFARIAARNEEEMKRMSYCGTDGYMSPSILLGEDFGLETDIFSLGVIFCEIISRRLVDDNTFKRVMPDFGLDSDEIRDLASPGCPPAFVELAIDCVTVDVAARPNIRQVLERLMDIEREVVESQAITEKTYNVGSLTFTAKNTGQRRGGGSKRPAGPGRIPSFQGQIQTPKYSDSEKDETGETSDEDVDDTLAKLSKLQVGNGRSGSTFYLNAQSAKGTSKLAIDDSDGNKAKVNTYSVIKGSKAINRSSIIFREPEFVEAPSVFSSVMTIKPDHTRQENFETLESLPSSPSSLIRAATDKDPEQTALNLEDGAASGCRPQDIGVFGTTTVEVKPDLSGGRPERLQEGSIESKPHASGDTPLPIAVLEDTVAVDRFATIKSMSMPIPATLNIVSSLPLSPDKKAFSPHRFTLIKPGWRALWDPKPRHVPAGQVSGMNVLARKRTENGQGMAGVLPMQLLGAGLLARCYVCEKRLGLMKHYLACDDCQHVYHVRCGDLTSPDCRLEEHTASLLESAVLDAATKDIDNKDKAKKSKGESKKKLSKTSPHASMIAV